MYEQSLVKEVEPLKLSLVSSMNKARKWKYGYDKEHDIIVISKNGEIGKIYDIQGLVVALPKVLTLILLVATTCTFSGLRQTSVNRTLEKQTDSSLYSGKHARQTQEAMACATLRIDGVVSASCQVPRL